MTSLAGTEVPVPVSADAAAARVDDLHRRYRRDVVDYCVRHLRSREEGEDAAQTVFLNAYRSLAKGTDPQYERAWLFAITEHVVSHRRHTNSRRSRFEVPVDADDLAYLAIAPPLDDAPDLSGLAGALSDMPPLESRALVLRELRGLTYKEIATELGVSGSVVETLLVRGRRRLADRMHDLRRTGKRALGLCLPWSSLQSLLSSGAAVKGVAGLASVAIFTAALPLHPAVTDAPVHAHVAAASHAVAAHRLPRGGGVLQPISRRFAPVHAVSPPTHSRRSGGGAAAPQPSPTIPAARPPSTAPVATSSPPAADVGESTLQPGTGAAAALAPAGDVTGSAPDTSAADGTGPPASPPGQSKRSPAPDPAGRPPTNPQDAKGDAASAGKGSPADGGAVLSR